MPSMKVMGTEANDAATKICQTELETMEIHRINLLPTIQQHHQLIPVGVSLGDLHAIGMKCAFSQYLFLGFDIMLQI